MNHRIKGLIAGAGVSSLGVAEASAQSLRDRFFGSDDSNTNVVSAGNGGVATSSANGGAVSIGDVNSGGEVIAGGNVIIWGRVRGVVHAGAFGDREAVVCALDLVPTQLRIADLITRSPDERGGRGPEIARAVGDQISVDAWEPHKR